MSRFDQVVVSVEDEPDALGAKPVGGGGRGGGVDLRSRVLEHDRARAPRDPEAANCRSVPTVKDKKIVIAKPGKKSSLLTLDGSG